MTAWRQLSVSVFLPRAQSSALSANIRRQARRGVRATDCGKRIISDTSFAVNPLVPVQHWRVGLVAGPKYRPASGNRRHRGRAGVPTRPRWQRPRLLLQASGTRVCLSSLTCSKILANWYCTKVHYTVYCARKMQASVPRQLAGCWSRASTNDCGGPFGMSAC